MNGVALFIVAVFPRFLPSWRSKRGFAAIVPHLEILLADFGDSIVFQVVFRDFSATFQGFLKFIFSINPSSYEWGGTLYTLSDRPASPSFEPEPLCHASSKEARQQYREHLQQVTMSYKKATSKLRGGKEATFPPGTTPPGFHRTIKRSRTIQPPRGP
jgi:hypothetical protein